MTAESDHEDDLAQLAMLYPEFVDRAMRSQEPVTRVREIGEHRVLYEAAQYNPETEIVWRANIDVDHHPDYDPTPSVHFSKCWPTSDAKIMQEWTSLATGRLSGPQDLGSWESLFTVFNAAMGLYYDETRDRRTREPNRTEGRNATD